MSPSSRRAWIEIRCPQTPTSRPRSPSSRRAWIEIQAALEKHLRDQVALLAEGVDRNWIACAMPEPEVLVALLAEGVDRNLIRLRSASICSASPSSRRAWIEITSARRSWQRWGVALLAEGVDRNIEDPAEREELVSSPSSRRAWIEIGGRQVGHEEASRRPPRGGRG